QLQDAERELRRRTEEIYSRLSAWQTVLVARHKDRPYSADYIRLICDDFFELHGDRAFGDDHAIITGPAKFDGQTVMLVCHQKGRDTKEKQLRNLGMPNPEGYRKAARTMQQAEKFGYPVICLIDTPAAFPGLGAEERKAAEAMRISTRGREAIDLIDELTVEPLGGAHHNYRAAADNLKAALIKQLADLQQVPVDELLARRYQKFRNIGKFGRASD